MVALLFWLSRVVGFYYMDANFHILRPFFIKPEASLARNLYSFGKQLG